MKTTLHRALVPFTASIALVESLVSFLSKGRQAWTSRTFAS